MKNAAFSDFKFFFSKSVNLSLNGVILAKKNAALFSKKSKLNLYHNFFLKLISSSEMYRTGYVAFQNHLFDYLIPDCLLSLEKNGTKI